MAKIETHFIPQNRLPNDGYIGVYNGTELVGKVKANALKMPDLGEKLYSFGVLSDVHVTYAGDTAKNRFAKALKFFNEVEKVAFTVIAGDLTADGTAAEYATYQNYVTDYSPNGLVYAITGNHDVYTVNPAPFETEYSTVPYTGHPLDYEIEQGGDLFLRVGMRGWSFYTGEMFTVDELTWLEQRLDANAGRRCFVISHVPYMEFANGVCSRCTSGALVGWKLPTGNLLNLGTTGPRFSEIIKGRNNVIWFHGHSHMEFSYQEIQEKVIYDTENTAYEFGRHSIHIPSLATGRKLNDAGTGWEGNDEKSGGYVVDVYANYIVLRGRDFANDKFVPTATYCLDTTPT